MLSFKGLERTNKTSKAISKTMYLGIISMTVIFEIL